MEERHSMEVVSEYIDFSENKELWKEAKKVRGLGQRIAEAAKVIRENVCWSRDNTAFFQRSQLEECFDQNALKYL